MVEESQRVGVCSECSPSVAVAALMIWAWRCAQGKTAHGREAKKLLTQVRKDLRARSVE